MTWLENIKVATALKRRLKQGYSKRDFKADLLAATVVALVAIPLSMALAIATGVAPQYGLYTAIIAGITVPLLGGSKFQVTGPTAAFVVILAPILNQYGFSGLLVAGLMAGIILIAMGIAGLGEVIKFIPHPVTTGFTTGIAVVIASIQIKDFFGLQLSGRMPDGFIERLHSFWMARHSISLTETFLAVSTVLILLTWPKISKKIPGPLAALFIVGVLATISKWLFPDLEFATINSRFGGIPHSLPQFAWPWAARAGGSPVEFTMSIETIRNLMPSAITIALLGAIESLLSAVVADGMTRTKHDPDAELVALGIGNILCPFFSGIAATGAISRTSTNIRSGANSPLACVFHALIIAAVVLIFAPLVGYLPMAALAGLLVIVAYNMSERRHFWRIVKAAPRGDRNVLFICFGLTVVFDMVVGVSVGTLLAVVIFIRRTTELTQVQLITPHAKDEQKWVPSDVLLYEIQGALFFGAAQRAIGAMILTNNEVKKIILDFHLVPRMDMTGLVALESLIQNLVANKKQIWIVGLQRQPFELIAKANLLSDTNSIYLASDIDQAVRAV